MVLVVMITTAVTEQPLLNASHAGFCSNPVTDISFSNLCHSYKAGPYHFKDKRNEAPGNIKLFSKGCKAKQVAENLNPGNMIPDSIL